MDLAAYASLARVSIVIPAPRQCGLSRVSGRRWSRGLVLLREDLEAWEPAPTLGVAGLPTVIAV